MLKQLLTALATITLSLAPGTALIALADDPTATPLPSFQPPTGVLRLVDARTASPVPAALVAAPAQKELVIFVGGYQTCACELAAHGTGFGDYADPAIAAGFDVKYFGRDPRFPYDSYGKVDVSGRTLRDEIRSLSSEYAAIHIVTHSMGGAVADQAFAQGLSAADGVATYVSLSGPHSGSGYARAAAEVNRNGPKELLHRIASLFGLESRSEALNDLASGRPIPPPLGVVRVDYRESTDALVTSRDAEDPGVPSRILNEMAEGHGGILSDSRVVALTMRTIATRRVPPDDRSAGLVEATNASSSLLALLINAALFVLTTILCVVYRTPVGRMAMTALTLVLPRAHRKPCP